MNEEELIEDGELIATAEPITTDDIDNAILNPEPNKVSRDHFKIRKNIPGISHRLKSGNPKIKMLTIQVFPLQYQLMINSLFSTME